ncbi:transcriptional regulator, XRE family with cupin sensor [Streptomyces zhaozhouensis]|uniref:Transcriptional regulator, XRE family with cupin sensor n=1 Tax=Streptomyces zhaozhouensis TaxID=1300267 RepID=A0A286DY42_9ACTN|nr:XRE family transcriptional regulator [Streptomyces zhaozhouensis]SOD63591.1 transcriptional regulator, XRE family with cupin sensor [Streptomyces zhaozhouensis]
MDGGENARDAGRARRATGAGAAAGSAGADLARVLNDVGPRLRALRRERDVTLAALSEETGISVSTLSRLESGRRKPTLELLFPLAKAYRVQLDELVGAPTTGDPRIHPRPFVRHGQTFIPLTRYLGGLHAYKQILPPHYGCDAEPRVHEGFEWCYVLSGQVRLRLGDRVLTLTAGEAAEFDTRVPHAFSNPGDQPAEYLSLFGAQGERMHVRARPTAGGEGGEEG